MVKVIATSKGYFGGEIREPGSSFNFPDDLWNDEKRRPSWAILAGAAAASAAVVEVEAKPVELIPIPADWEDMSAADRRALASKISGAEVKRAPDADKIIEAYLEANKPEVFGDAPEPQTITEAQKAAGGVEPDWIAPGDTKQVAD